METKVQEQARVVSSLMAKIVRSAANVATSAVDDMTTEYEKNRLVRIRKNKERLASLEIADAVAELQQKSVPLQPPNGVGSQQAVGMHGNH